MSGKYLLPLCLFVLSFVQVRAQYVNTDSLIVVPGYLSAVTIFQFDSIQKQKTDTNQSYFAEFDVPGEGRKIISRFGPRSGRMHYGTDIKMQKGDTIYAACGGVVSRSSYYYGFGNLVVLQHKNNLETYYGHLSEFLVEKHSWVNKGEAIGLAGSTGRATTSHLHFEIHENGRVFDSELVFDYENQKVRDDACHTKTLAALHKELKPKGYSNSVAVPEYYKVCSGDSLWVISRKFKTSIKEICRLNQLTENSVLQIGQPLRLY
ncbi:peptidoglycan DD-metalloendopeptidase family protein [Maribellus comscasis]|uniref:Peptidoglycan DD-metalloendopeptidase family protein n=1 Tax=Maribellus comscasis TaxID=2681766 RepID=A0A6I6JYF8_9BACT|nr:M23 family metallopeptidase [Maribellus comscasis]QGY45267.1 peptidoglycan DD-metalloendopeptidase family protein [Maribellus comscasis]